MRKDILPPLEIVSPIKAWPGVVLTQGRIEPKLLVVARELAARTGTTVRIRADDYKGRPNESILHLPKGIENKRRSLRQKVNFHPLE